MNSKKINNIYKYTIIIIITAFITFILTSTFVYRFINNDERYYIKNSKTESSSLEQTLSYFKEILEKKYIGEIDEEELKESAIKGYIAGLNDPYTEYFTKEEMQEFTEETEGEYVGIGIYTTTDTKQNAIVVLRTIGDSPASKAGLLTGDIITKVDDQVFTGEQLNEAVKKMKGISGTNVKITVLRNDKEMEFDIKRENIKISHVSSNVLNDKIGYIKISSFEGGCSEEFLDKYKEIEKQNIKSLIIDLRFNGGGIVDEALNIAELMVPKDKVLLITKDKTEEEDIVKAKKDASINMPVVVLVNEYSASASEILAGILKEDINAILVGNTTYGKGVIQTVYPLKDGSGLKITTDEYYTPNHNKINKVGIEPTLKVEIPEELKQITNLPLEQDIQLQKAIEELK
ncbi:MAG: S41 family peptidase [Clostridia bacterium]|nr:S41 family peptidase [Clostridia bacterium]